MKTIKDITSEHINKIYSIIVGRECTAGKIEWTPDRKFVVAIFKVEESHVYKIYDPVKMENNIDTVEMGITIDENLEVRYVWNWKNETQTSVDYQPLYNHHQITKYLLDEGFDLYSETNNL